MKLHAVLGNSLKLDGGSMFGNAPKEMWAKWCPPDELNRIDIATRALLLQTDAGENILFETGVGAFFDPKLKERYGVVESEHILLHNLQKLGVKERDIDAVIISHLHFDHIGGILPEFGDSPPKLLFLNADYYIGRRQWEAANKPHPREKSSFIPIVHELLKESNHLKLMEEGGSLKVTPKVSFRFFNGHTVGLMVSEIELPSAPLLFISDLVPGLPWVHIPITMGYDRFPELVVEEKRALFEELIKKGGHLFFNHDPLVACAKVERDEKGRFFAAPVEIDTLY